MLNKAKQPNQLLEFLTTENLLRKRSTFSLVDSKTLCDFPSLSLEDLRNITMGVYQIHQAPFYVKEHLDEDGTFQLMVHKESDSLIKLKIQSRHSKSVSHTLWIQHTPEQITGWYCTCKVGARVVGCCAHIARPVPCGTLGMKDMKQSTTLVLTLTQKTLMMLDTEK